MKNTSPSCLIIAGEKSGEEHALSFLRELKDNCPQVQFWGVGGDEMRELDVELTYHLKDFSSWGFSEVIGKIPFYFKAFRDLKLKVKEKNCKVAILIDFQDFNLRLAKALSKEGVQILYYVAPQAWAWKAYRAKALEETVHTLFTIIPFEKDWFEQRGVRRVQAVAHPVWLTYGPSLKIEELGIDKKSYRNFKTEIKILLLPGSRHFEVAQLLPLFTYSVRELKKRHRVTVGLVPSPNVRSELYGPYEKDIDIIFNHERLEHALTWADMAMAASGTVTLTCALFQVPTVVAYSTSFFNEFIFNTFLNYRGFISLANIVHEQEVFPELVQEYASSYNIIKKLSNWIENEDNYNETKIILEGTARLLQGESSLTVNKMVSVLKETYGV
jgi:lipid-A-disaccharide synthase